MYVPTNDPDITCGMTDQEIREACEVFELPDGRFLVVEG